MKKVIGVFIFLSSLVICGLYYEQNIRVYFKEINFNDYASCRIQKEELWKEQNMKLSLYLMDIHCSVFDEAWDYCVLLKDADSIGYWLKYPRGYRVGVENDTLFLTTEYWNDMNMWIKVEYSEEYKGVINRRYAEPKIQDSDFLEGLSRGVYKYSDGQLTKSDDFEEIGDYYITSFSLGKIHTFDLNEIVKKYYR